MNDYSRLTKAQLIERLNRLNAPGDPNDLAGQEAADSLPLQAVKELQDLKAALDAHSIVAITDPRGRITYVNDKFCEISKYSRGELIGQDHRIINSGYHSKEFIKSLWTEIERGRVWKGELRNRAKDGSVYWVDTTIFPFLDSAGTPTQFIAIRTDITQRKRDEAKLAELAQSLAEKNKELETIVYVASHDLRSPLVNIQGFSKELARACEQVRAKLAASETQTIDKSELESIVATDVPEALGYIMAGVSKIDALLAGFLRFSRLGRAALRIEKLNMNAVLASIQQAMEFQIQKAGATLRVADLPPCMGDATQINQVFSNLLDNALKYRDPGRPALVEVSGWAEDGKSVYKVSDNGIGIALNYQEQIFRIFGRLHGQDQPGTGIGLALCKKLIERNGGRLWVESKLGEGSTFLFSVPTLGRRV